MLKMSAAPCTCAEDVLGTLVCAHMLMVSSASGVRVCVCIEGEASDCIWRAMKGTREGLVVGKEAKEGGGCSYQGATDDAVLKGGGREAGEEAGNPELRLEGLKPISSYDLTILIE